VTNPRIAIVVGAGFAGLNAAKTLANREAFESSQTIVATITSFSRCCIRSRPRA
jgi:succinate dehydrogenase/fumarate reductase flavoprotein subunit